MKQLIIFLLCCFALIACKLQNENLTQDADYKPSQLTELIAGNSKVALNIDRYLSAMEAVGFSGAIIVSEDDKVVLRKGYGFADRETRRPYTPNTIQTNGSITKQFTAAAILLLESRGELSVRDSITKYFENVSEEKQDITIHQLLTHSSGLPGAIGADSDPIGAQAYVDKLMKEPLQFNPGSNYAYSNSGYSLLGIIVEKITGESYETFLRNKVLLPAGLSETGYFLPDWDMDRMAVGYRNGERWGEIYQRSYLPGRIEDGPSWHYRANGGLLTTVDDMHTWLGTVQGHGILDEVVVKRWTTGYVKESNGYSNYGYGLVVYDHNRWGKIITHSGSNRVFEADFVWLPERKLFFYIHGNSSMVRAASQSGNILAAAFDSTFVMPPLVEMNVSAQPDIAQQREGVYHVNERSLEMISDDTRLIAKLWGQTVLDIMFRHNDEQRKRFVELNQRTRDAMAKLKNGQEDALAGLMHEGEDPIGPANALQRRINQIGNLDSLHVIGTFANTPGSRFANYGPWTTFIYAEFANWNQYWNIVWNDDGTYQGEYSGPWPSFTLIPSDKNSYVGIRQGGNWRTIKLKIRGNCVMLSELKACKE